MFTASARSCSDLARRPATIPRRARACCHSPGGGETCTKATLVSHRRRSRPGDDLRPLSGTRTRGALPIRRRSGRGPRSAGWKVDRLSPGRSCHRCNCGDGRGAIPYLPEEQRRWSHCSCSQAVCLPCNGGVEAQAKAEIAKLREGVMEFAQMEAQVCQPGEKKMQEDVYASACQPARD